METKVYILNKGINRSIEFKGLKAQYIWYVGGLVTGGMLVFAVLHVCGMSGLLAVPVVSGVVGAGIYKIYRLSHRYGEYGLMKRRAERNVPKALRISSRIVFFKQTAI
jgi:hypothetical protein